MNDEAAPTASGWPARFSVEGALEGRRYGITRQLPVPRELTATWSPEAGLLALTGVVSDGAANAYLGFAFLTDQAATLDTIGGIYLTAPTSSGATVTFGFLCTDPLTFRALGADEGARCTTTDDTFELEVNRSNDEIRLNIQPVAEATPRSHFHHGTFIIDEHGSTGLPWPLVTVTTTIASDAGQLHGTMTLQRLDQ